MIVFDLRCPADHVFEAWFGSSGDFESQKSRGLVACPICNSTAVEKAVMAPAVGAKGNQARAAAAGHALGGDPAKTKAMLSALAKAQAEVVAGSDYVGNRFAEEARAIHYGESEARGIYGETRPEEARRLTEEGIGIAPLLFPVRPKGTDA